MNFKIKYFKLLILLSIISISNLYSQEVLDKIAAVVDNEIIMKSEIDFQANMVAAQRKMDSSDPQLREQILNSMIEEKLVYAQALVDSITATEEEVNRQVDAQIDYFMQQYGSKEKVEQIYGMSIERIKRVSRENIKKDLLIRKLQEKKFGSVEASRKEIEEFYENYKDSLGVIPERVKIYHIFKNPKASDILKEKYKKLAESILDSIKQGVDFSEMAKKYSEDPGSASQGGDLGFVRKGIFYPEFEAAAFALNEGEISNVIESPVGFHIIQLLEKRGETIHTQHILIKIMPDDETDLNIIEFLTSIRDSIINQKGTFSDFAKKYSDDKETAQLGGLLGNFYVNQLDKNLIDVVSQLKEGEISFPKRINYSNNDYGYHIVYLEKRIPQHQPDINLDYEELKNLADEYKRQKLYNAWINELKSKIYWEVRI